MFSKLKKNIIGSVREIIFGLEDSLVSTMGAITGIAIGTQDRAIVVISGLVILAVEATSMAAGSFLSTETSELANNKLSKTVSQKSIKAAGVMFVSYILGGLIPLLPYLFLKPSLAVLPSIFFSVVALTGVGLWAGRITGRAQWKVAVEMVIISITAAIVGYAVGWIASHYFEISTIL